MWKGKLGRPSRRGRAAARLVGLESLDGRVMPAITAVSIPAAGLLAIVGDGLDNSIVVSRDAAGSILVNGVNVR